VGRTACGLVLGGGTFWPALIEPEYLSFLKLKEKESLPLDQHRVTV
jgi:hypothetical protein